MKHILVVGGAGYIGSHVALELQLAGFRVSVLDNLSSGTTDNLVEGIHFIKGDIMDRAKLKEVFSTDFDGVVHLAGLKAAGESMKQPGRYSQQNISGTINLLEAIDSSSCNIIIFSSTASVYGHPKTIPVDEEHPVDPINFYGFTKLEIERLLQWYDKLNRISFISLRYFNAAGYDILGRIKGVEYHPNNLIPIVMEVATGERESLEVYGRDYATPDGTCLRDYIHVSDLAKAHIKALTHLINTHRSSIMNLGTEQTHSVLDVINMAEKITAKKISYHFTSRRSGDPHALCASSKKALKILNWSPQCSDLKSIIKSTWEVYKEIKTTTKA